MANNQFNPLTAPLTMLKQVGEQAASAIQQVGTGLTTMASQGLDTLIAGVPGIPGVPGVAAAPGLPTPQQLMPANLQQVMTQVENLLIPPGLPKPSQVVTAAQPIVTQPAPTVEQPAAPAQEAPPAVAQRRRVAERRGL